MAGNVTGLHRFADDVGPEPLALLDTNFDALTQTLNTLGTYSNFYVDTGTTNALTVTPPSTQNVSYTDGLKLEVRVAATNTGPSTLNVGALGPKPIQLPTGAALASAQLQAGTIYPFVYNASRNAWQLGGGGGGGSVGGTVTAPFHITDSTGTSFVAVVEPTAPVAAGTCTVSIAPAGTDHTHQTILCLNGATDGTVFNVWGASNTVTGPTITNTTPWLATFHGAGWYPGQAPPSYTGPNPGTSFGVLISAGTNANDVAFQVENDAMGGMAGVNYSQFFVVKGDGSGSLGPAGYPNGMIWGANGSYYFNPTVTMTAPLVSIGSNPGQIGLTVTDQGNEPLIIVTAPGAGLPSGTAVLQVRAPGAEATNIEYLLSLGYSEPPVVGNANGMWIAAGTNASDFAIQTYNAASTKLLFSVKGDGSGALGPAPNQLIWNASGNFSLTGTATLPGGGTGGVQYLSQLLDVSLTTQTNGQVLTWNSTTSRWVNQSITGAVPPGSTLISPITISPGSGTTLTLNGAANQTGLAVNGATNTATGGWVATFHSSTATGGFQNGVLISAATGTDTALEVTSSAGSTPLFTVNGNGSGVLGPSPNQLIWNTAGNFTLTGTATLPAGALAGLTDVTLASPANGQVLGYNGTKWVNTAPTGGGGGGSPFTTPFYVNQPSGTSVLSVITPTSGSPTGSGAIQLRAPGGTAQSPQGYIATFAYSTAAAVGNSNGIWLAAGTNSSDLAIQVYNQADTLLMFGLYGDGSGTLGSTNKMTWNANGFTFTTTNAAVQPLSVVFPPATVAGIWLWQIGGGTPSGSSPGCSNGLRVAAGTNANDSPFTVRNDADTTTYMQIKGDGSGSLSKETWSATGVFTIGPSTDPNALALIVRGAPHTTHNLWKFQIGGGASGDATDCSNGLYVGAGTSVNDVALWVQNDAGTVDYLKVIGSGAVYMPAVGSTATAANTVLDTNRQVLLSTSAARFKRDVQPVARKSARETVKQLRAVSYRSRCAADDPRRTHYGLIAEEVAEVDPNLVTYDSDGQPAGVQYERIAMLLLPLVQELLEARA